MKCECEHLKISHVYRTGLDRGHCLALGCECIKYKHSKEEA